jgi:hypothetical protein
MCNGDRRLKIFMQAFEAIDKLPLLSQAEAMQPLPLAADIHDLATFSQILP